jgi:glycosyltransferase involved in cell wall biosynthesis
MLTDPSVSIIVCTCNRASSLRNTLDALRRLQKPPGWRSELIVVDNGSVDDTVRVVEEAKTLDDTLRYIREPERGLSRARNAGLRAATGAVLLFTDDDVIVAPDWALEMVRPLFDGRYDVVTGRIIAAQHLQRPWMKSMHRTTLALTEGECDDSNQLEVFGASMGFGRHVLTHVSEFDPALGAGALGFGEETLFVWQLREAGFRVGYVEAARAVHDFSPARLTRASLLQAAQQRGRSMAYMRHHWQHGDIPKARATLASYWIRLHLRRIVQRPAGLDAEGCQEWEMSYVFRQEMIRHFLAERHRPRKYQRYVKGRT